MAIHTHYHVILQGTAASRPAAPAKDLLYYATDTGTLSAYDSVGAAWTTLVVASGWTQTGSNTTAFNAIDPLTTKGDIIVHDGTNSVRHAAGADYTLPVFDSANTDNLRNSYRNRSLTLYAEGVTRTYTTGAAYTAIFSTGTSNPTHTKIDITGFRQARLLSFGGVQAGSVDATIKAVDTTNAVDISGTINFSSTTLSQGDSGWGNLNALSYAGDIQIEVQAIEGAGGADVLRIDNLILEFR